MGQFDFVSPRLPKDPLYSTIKSRLSGGGKFLDLGTCFGQDIRALIADGVPSEALYATDLKSDLWELGYSLFNDRDLNATTFFAADFLSSTNDGVGNAGLKGLEASVDVIHAASFFHLFDWSGQIVALQRVVALSKIGTLMVGHQVGNERAVAQQIRHRGTEVFYHDEETWRKIWRDVELETGTEWEVSVEKVLPREFGLDPDDWKWMGSDRRILHFSCARKA